MVAPSLTETLCTGEELDKDAFKEIESAIFTVGSMEISDSFEVHGSYTFDYQSTLCYHEIQARSTREKR